MADVLVIGGGVVGLSAGMLLARDGHEVTVLERDPAAPPAPLDAWSSWERRGVNQFRLLHYFLPRFRGIVEHELPEVAVALEAAGALRFNPVHGMPEQLNGGIRPDDDRFGVLTARRPVAEAVVAATAAATDGLAVRRGVAVTGLLTGDPVAADVSHVVGVVTDRGEEIRADLVVDAGGRRSAMPDRLEAIGAARPLDDRDDCGFVYYGRHFRSDDGSVPFAFGPLLQPYDSVSILTLPADNGHWGVGIVTSARDREARALREQGTWERIVRSFPLVAHWLDGDPLTGVEVMAGIEDRVRDFWPTGRPVATGVLPLGDAYACTNPSVGRGASIGLMHAVALRDLLRSQGGNDAFELSLAWRDVTEATVAPYVRDTLAFDRHRLAEMEAQIAGTPYETDDAAHHLGRALAGSATRDPDLLRGYLEVVSMLGRGVDVLSRPGVAERALELVRADPPEPFPGPARAELVALLAG
jgi:2-polyprenyl-6-methoxyphenol hydroxylase-like FAD-dependent oxidoreductase